MLMPYLVAFSLFTRSAFHSPAWNPAHPRAPKLAPCVSVTTDSKTTAGTDGRLRVICVDPTAEVLHKAAEATQRGDTTDAPVTLPAPAKANQE